MRKHQVRSNFVILFLISLISCNSSNIITTEEYSNSVTEGFEKTKQLAANRSDALFGVFDKTLTINEEAALKFYYSAMPLSDLADYSGEYFLENVRLSLKSREEYDWTRELPEHIFLHYVLPVRVNNENLDNFRLNYYNELSDRVSDIETIEEAALEINHWCHEKVTYQSADIRTSAPESTILSARGRCGEESTFTVAALRTAGIPARQIYVPRWAHSDDNHAWVEVWIDGVWKYLGACEPDPVLNSGWFTEPASRAMLTHSKAFGKYFGSESLVEESNFFAEINTLSNYAQTRDVSVMVVDENGNRVEEAEVSFGQLNYAEFYPLASIKTGTDGLCEFKTGEGDLLVWANKGSDFGFAELAADKKDVLTIALREDLPQGEAFNFDIYGPPGTRVNPTISKEMASKNRELLKQEDSIRQQYISGWISEDEISQFASENNYLHEEIAPLIKTSMGNFGEIIKFLKILAPEERKDGLSLLNIIADKDLRDTPSEVLYDHVKHARKYDLADYSQEFYLKYILNPRIDNEIIKPWRSYILEQQNDESINQFRSNPTILVDWMNEYLTIDLERNYYNVPISPIGVLTLGVSDAQSRDILFVACCRACGIPSRLEPGTKLPQYFMKGTWVDVFFKDRGKIEPRTSLLTLISGSTERDPEYYKHFTLSKINNGKYTTLEYDYNRKTSEFTEPLRLSPGNYMLVTSNRTNDSQNLSSIEFFELKADEQITLDISMRESAAEELSYSSFIGDSLQNIKGENLGLQELLLNGAILAWIDHEKEPTKHLLKEMQELHSEFNGWDGNIVFISDPGNLSESFDPNQFSTMLNKSIIAFDKDFRLLEESFPEMSTEAPILPVVLYVQSDKSVIYKSSGYKIGYGDILLELINK